MAEIINCPDCMGKGCSSCNDTGEMLCFGVSDMQRAANVLSTIREGQAEHPGLAPRWWIVPVHRGSPEEMASRASLIAEHPHLCMVDVGDFPIMNLPGSTNIRPIEPGPDWSQVSGALGGADAT